MLSVWRGVAYLGFVSAGTVSAVLVSTPVAAQVIAPSQLTPADLRPAPPPTRAIELPAAAGLTAPGAVADLSVSLAAVSVAGDLPEIADAARALSAEVSGRRLTIGRLYELANRLERDLGDAGYAFVRVVVPPQKLESGGTFRLVVVAGHLEAIDVSGVPERLRDLVRARMEPLIGRRGLKRDELERRLTLINQLPGVRMRTTQAPGADGNGGTRIVFEGTLETISGSIGTDNRSPDSMGGPTNNYSVALNTPFGWGEQFYLTGSSGWRLDEVWRRRSPLAMIGGGFTLPIGGDGFALNAEYAHSITQSIPAPGTPATIGVMDRLELRAMYPLFKTRSHSLMLQGSWQWLDQTLAPLAFDTQLYRDLYTLVRIQAEHQIDFSGGSRLITTGVYTHGLGGREAPDPRVSPIGLSRAAASPKFEKLGLTMRWSTPLPEDFRLQVTARGQTTFGEAMLVSESFALDGADAASGFASGTFSVDEGVTLRNELVRDIVWRVQDLTTQVSPYVFSAGGRGFTNHPSPVQQARVDVASLGVGLRLALDRPGFPPGGQIGLEFARSASDGSVPQLYRFTVQASLRF